MTQQFWLLILLIYGLIFSGLATLNSGLLLLAVPFLLYVAAGLLHRPTEIHLSINRDLNAEHIGPDEPVVVTVTITNEGLALDELYLEDVVPSPLAVTEGTNTLLTGLPDGARVEIDYTLHGPRGAYTFSGVRVIARDSFNLFSRTLTLPAHSHLLVLPEVIKLRRVDIRPRQTRIYAGTIPAAQGGPGVEFFGLRAYQPGDPLRWINSRATARHAQNIFINEFQQERLVDVGLILDARQQSYGPAANLLFEKGIRATAALANEFLNTGNRVGLFIYGNTLDWTYPGYGKMQRQRILWALARAAPSDSQVFAKLDHLPTQLFPAHSQLVFVSPLLPSDAGVLTRLRARGYQLLVVSPDPVLFERQRLAQERGIKMATRIATLERALLLGKLRQAGIRMLDWPPDIPFQEAVHRTLGQYQPLRS